jgi:hypothetical protein
MVRGASLSGPRSTLEGAAIDRALSAMGNFADLVSPYLAGHSAGVAELASAAAQRYGLDPAGVTAVRRAAFVHDVGRVVVPIPIRRKEGPLTAGEWERIRLQTTPSACSAARRFSVSPRLRRRTTSDSKGRAATAGRWPRRSHRPRGYLRRPTPTAPSAPSSPGARARASRRDAAPGRTGRAPRRRGSRRGARRRRTARAPDRAARRSDRSRGRGRRAARAWPATKQVAHALGITVKTADTHVQLSTPARRLNGRGGGCVTSASRRSPSTC